MPAVDVEYRILGPLQAVSGGEALPLGGPMQRSLLAAFLLHPNEPLSTERLVDALWGATPPSTAAHAVSVYVSKLRKALGADAIGRAQNGYLLRVAPGSLDLERFEELVSTARLELAAGDASRACDLLDEALALWRGPALADVRLEDFAQATAARLDELRVVAIEAQAEAKLALGRHGEVLPELESLAGSYPLDERLCELHMLALYRAGRQSEALARYRVARTRLSEELGIEPSQALQELERRILAQDPSLTRLQEAAEVRSVVVVPRRLERLDELVQVTEPFGLSRNPHEVILTWIEPAGPARAVSEALGAASALLARVRDDLVVRGVRARVATFTSGSPAEDVLLLARRPEVDLIVLDRELGELDDGPLDAELAGIVATAPCDVALWFRGEHSTGLREGPILVPFGGADNDWAALELGAWVADTLGRDLVIVGIARDSGTLCRDASRLLADAGLLIQRTAGIVAHPRLAEPGPDELLDAFSDGGLVVAGLSDRWASEGLGATRLALARASEAPVLFLRGGLRPGGLSPPETLTLHRWSVSARR